jgi:hypothetical protein
VKHEADRILIRSTTSKYLGFPGKNNAYVSDQGCAADDLQELGIRDTKEIYED